MCATAVEAEAGACVEGVRLALEWVREPAVTESDCAELIDRLKADAKSRSSWCNLEQDIKAACILLPGHRFVKVKRDANTAGHNLAQLAAASQAWAVWMFMAPSCIETIIESDLVISKFNRRSANRSSIGECSGDVLYDDTGD